MTWFQVLLLGVLTLGLVQCSTIDSKTDHWVHRIIGYQLHIRRPEAAAAKPTADRYEPEYTSHPLPNERFDCEPFDDMYKKFSFKDLKKCLVAVNYTHEGAPISYLLDISQAEPVWRLEQKEDTPDCIRTSLQTIPVPREIFFQGEENGKLGCYSSSVEFVQSSMRLSFRLEGLPNGEADMLQLIKTWSIAPFVDDSKQAIRAKAVSTEICLQCMGRENVFLNGEKLPPYWTF